MKATDNGFERFPEDFHADVKTAFIKTDKTEYYWSVACIVCGESVQLSENESLALQKIGRGPGSKMCDKCKKVILHARERMESEYELCGLSVKNIKD